jgi:hypothetical protein
MPLACAHLAARGGEYQARLDQRINEKVGGDARRDASAGDDVNDRQLQAKSACRNSRADCCPNAATE